MRRRDRIYFGVLAALVFLHAVGICSAVYFYARNCRRLSVRMDRLEKELLEARAEADASRAAMARAFDQEQNESSDTLPTPSPPRLVGYGQTKSLRARYIYADYEFEDGTMQRRFIKRFPL